MANYHAFAFILLAAAILLLFALHQAAWMLWIIPVSFLMARALAGGGRSPNTLARPGRKG